MGRKQSKRLVGLERTEAKLVCEEMLCKRVTTRTIVEALVVQYAVSPQSAGKVLAEATAEMQAAVKAAQPHRREQQIASLDRLYERALDMGKLTAALGVQRLLAKIEGTEKPTKHQHTGIPAPVAAAAGAATGDPEFEGKTLEELEYYADKGYWPDEGPEESEPAKGAPEFPLH